MTHRMHLDHGPFVRIETGAKTIELRLNDEKRKRIQVGDRILFDDRSAPSETLTAEVAALHRFRDFRELYAHLPLEKCGYGAEEVKTAKAEDMLVYYSIEQQQLYGVLGIELRLLPS